MVITVPVEMCANKNLIMWRNTSGTRWINIQHNMAAASCSSNQAVGLVAQQIGKFIKKCCP